MQYLVLKSFTVQSAGIDQVSGTPGAIVDLDPTSDAAKSLLATKAIQPVDQPAITDGNPNPSEVEEPAESEAPATTTRRKRGATTEAAE